MHKLPLAAIYGRRIEFADFLRTDSFPELIHIAFAGFLTIIHADFCEERNRKTSLNSIVNLTNQRILNNLQIILKYVEAGAQGSRFHQNLVYVTDGNIMYLTDASRFLISCVIQHYAPVVGWRNRCIMLIMTLDPSWRQTLSWPPTGIEPGSPAS